METQVAIRISFVSFLAMIPGFFCWVYIYLAPLRTNIANIFFVTLLGSIFLGLVIFFFSTGNFLYFQFHLAGLPIHWFYRGIFRTLIQFYNIVSYLIIFVSSQQIYPLLNPEFFIIFFFFIIPVIVSYPLARWQRIRSWFEQFASNSVGQNTTE